MVDPHTSETLIIFPPPSSCRKLRHQKQHKRHRCDNIRLARFKRKTVLRGQDIKKTNRKRKENSRWPAQQGTLSTCSSRYPQPAAPHPPALMCPIAASACVPPISTSAVYCIEQLTPVLALPNIAGLPPIPTSPGQAQLDSSEMDCIGTKAGVTIRGTAHTVQPTQTPTATTKPCHSDQGSSVTKKPDTPPPHRAVHGVISHQPKSWLYCEICQYRTNNTKPGKARRRLLTHMRLQYGVPS